MTKKSKIVTLVIVLLVLVAGGAGMYFKGGDLMGRMGLRNIPYRTAAEREIQEPDCPSEPEMLLISDEDYYPDSKLTPSNLTASKFNDFDDFHDFVEADFANKASECRYKITVVKEDETTESFVCAKSQLSVDEGYSTSANVFCKKDHFSNKIVEVTLFELPNDLDDDGPTGNAYVKYYIKDAATGEITDVDSYYYSFNFWVELTGR
jgi:hypothetical protein